MIRARIRVRYSVWEVRAVARPTSLWEHTASSMIPRRAPWDQDFSPGDSVEDAGHSLHGMEGTYNPAGPDRGFVGDADKCGQSSRRRHRGTRSRWADRPRRPRDRLTRSG